MTDPHGSARHSPEDWFVRRGVKSLLEGSSVRADPGRRMVLPMAVIYLALSAWSSTSSGFIWDLILGVLSLLVTWLAANLSQRQRPFSAIRRIGPVEIVVFLTIPTLLDVTYLSTAVSLTWPERLLLALPVLVLQVVLLLLIWALVSSGIVDITVWLLRELAGSMNQVGVALARTLPLLLGVVTFTFLAAESWQSMGRVKGIAYVGVMLLFMLVSGLFLASRWQLDMEALARFETREDVAAAMAHTSCTLAAPDVEGPFVTPLGPRQRFNLRLVVALSKLAVAATVALGVFAFFLVFGFLAIDAGVVKAWAGADPRILWQGAFLNQNFALTLEHVKVAGFIAVFAGFYFSVVSATDTTLRAGLKDTAEEAVREACAARISLLHHYPPT